MRGPQVQSPRSSRGRSARRDMRSVGRSGQAERGRVKGEAHVSAERMERARARAPAERKPVSQRSSHNSFRNLIYSVKNKLFLNADMH